MGGLLKLLYEENIKCSTFLFHLLGEICLVLGEVVLFSVSMENV